ncbi:hypothetical protein P3T18_005929 [Paraburkholderia sp. GAS199]|uniref:hypothetical protein n=1 Tax=Paraburkholderia sp. GAS199 TaxID=3035126 RepID=UPI003D1F60B7
MTGMFEAYPVKDPARLHVWLSFCRARVSASATRHAFCALPAAPAADTSERGGRIIYRKSDSRINRTERQLDKIAFVKEIFLILAD